MGIAFVEFLEQISEPMEKEPETSVVCECSLGQLVYDALGSLKYNSSGNCKVSGVCAFVQKSKHQATINTAARRRTEMFQKKIESEEASKTRSLKKLKQKEQKIGNQKDPQTISGYRFKALDRFI